MTTPHDLDPGLVGALLRDVAHVRGTGPRMDALSSRLLGYPYREYPLIGSPETAEVLTVSLEGFDCVTFVESLMALAGARSPAGFVRCLRRVRYRNGVVDWRSRNHYMTGWIRENSRAGFVRNLTRGRGLIRRERRLDVVAGIRARKAQVASIQKDEFIRRHAEIETGDLVFFASTRPHLDVFHCGVLIRSDGFISLRHAARSRGRVVEQPLEEFLADNRMAGVILVRPEEVFPKAA